MQLFNAGLYIRLSKEDEGVLDESRSVENQRFMLSKFVSLIPGWIETKTYVDSGISGGTFARPAFQEMISDARECLINLVVVKDLSRFGRNYIEAGNYLETVLPELGCRFVSILEGVDTEKENNDIMHFYNAMNDHYLKSLSDKIKTVLHAKAKNGEFLAGYIPYGYQRKTDVNGNINRLEIDGKAAKVVRQIFVMRLENKGYTTIAAELTRQNIQTPRAYYYAKQEKECKGKMSPFWSAGTVKAILTHEVYIGHSVQHKTHSVNHRTKKMMPKNSEDWIRIENTHEPIVSQETFDAVQKINLRTSDPTKHYVQVKSLFSKILYCKDCGRPMCKRSETEIRKTGKAVRYNSFSCSGNISSGNSFCTRHTIYELSLKKVITAEINRHAEAIKTDEVKIREQLLSALAKQSKPIVKDSKKQIKSLEKRLNEIALILEKIYEDKVNGEIDNDTFKTQMKMLEIDRTAKQAELEQLQAVSKEMNDKIANIDKWVETIKNNANQVDVTREMLENLIERIEVGEREIINGNKHRELNIYYKFVGMSGL